MYSFIMSQCMDLSRDFPAEHSIIQKFPAEHSTKKAVFLFLRYEFRFGKNKIIKYAKMALQIQYYCDIML